MCWSGKLRIACAKINSKKSGVAFIIWPRFSISLCHRYLYYVGAESQGRLGPIVGQFKLPGRSHPPPPSLLLLCLTWLCCPLTEQLCVHRTVLLFLLPKTALKPCWMSGDSTNPTWLWDSQSRVGMEKYERIKQMYIFVCVQFAPPPYICVYAQVAHPPYIFVCAQFVHTPRLSKVSPTLSQAA